MDTIKILPHHVSDYFEVHFLNREPGKNHSYYDDPKFKQHSEATITAVVSNPSQLVQIVSSYDSFCRMCPRNKRGQNFVQPEETCTTYEDANFANELDTAKMLGIDGLIDKDPIPAEELFDKLKPVYKKIFTEEPKQNSMKLTPREYFRVSSNELILLQQTILAPIRKLDFPTTSEFFFTLRQKYSFLARPSALNFTARKV